MNKNIPIYRAKKIGSDEYVIGFYAYDEVHKIHLIITNAMHGLSETRIDVTTLSIHFPDMLDSKGKKIFASLQENGKGGDIVEYNGRQEIIKYSNGTIQTYMFRFEDLKELNFKAVGIQE